MRIVLSVLCALMLQQTAVLSDLLPAAAQRQLLRSLEESRGATSHIWRDTEPLNPDGTVNGYVEIARGDRRKWEFDMSRNARAIDRVLPRSVGGYPVNYGFVPRTVSYDGDPFDVLVLGPPIAGGRIVRGMIVGLMHMEDEKGLDSKVVLSPIGPDQQPLSQLTDADRRRIGDFFQRYKRHERGKFSKVPGWGSPEEGRAFVRRTNAFFQRCRQESPCRVTE